MSEAATDFEKLKQRFETGLTKSKSHREQQLQNLIYGLNLMSEEIVESIQADLQQGYFTSWQQLADTRKEIQYTMKKIAKWQRKSGTTDLLQLFTNKETISLPKGTVAVVVDLNTSNILQRTLIPLSTAIAAGNCVVLKLNSPMENTKKSIEKLVHEFLDNFCTIYTDISVEELLKNDLDHVHFIGSSENKKQIQKLIVNKDPALPFSSEVTCQSPVIIDSDADIEDAAVQISANKWTSAGQNQDFSISQVFVHHSLANEFLSKLQINVEKQFGNDARTSPEYARIMGGVEQYQSILENQKITYGGQLDVEQNYLSPTIISSKTLGNIQGPILPVFTFEKLNKIVSRLNDETSELNLFLFSRNKDNAQFVQQNLAKLNNLYINTCFDVNHPFQIGALRGLYGFELVSKQFQVTKQNYRVLKYFPPYNQQVQGYIKNCYKVPYLPQKCVLYGLAGLFALGGFYQYSKRPGKK